MKIRNKAGKTEKKVSLLQKSQNENVGWWLNHTEDEKIAMGLRPAYYKPISEFKKTKEEKELLKRLKVRFKTAQLSGS